MKKILSTIFAFAVIFATLPGCGDKSKTGEKKSNDLAINKDYENEQAGYQKEQVAMADEHKKFDDLFNAMKAEHARVVPTPTAEYDSLIANQQRLLDEHSKMVNENVTFLTEHSDIIKQHADNKISDKDIQDKSTVLHKKHKKSSDDHDALVKKYEELNKKHLEFITKAGGKTDFAPKEVPKETEMKADPTQKVIIK